MPVCARDLKSLREELLAKGLSASEIACPECPPGGESCLQDPDGYTLQARKAMGQWLEQSGTETLEAVSKIIGDSGPTVAVPSAKPGRQISPIRR